MAIDSAPADRASGPVSDLGASTAPTGGQNPEEQSAPRGSWETAAPLLARTTMVALGASVEIIAGVTIGTVLALLLAPVWTTALHRFRGGRSFAALGAATLVWGLALSELTSSTHAVNSNVLKSFTALLGGVVVGVCAILWARTILRVPEVALWFGVGMVLHAGLSGPGSNPWKFTGGIPLAIVAFGAVGIYGRTRSRPRAALVGAGVMILFSGISAVFDSRSYAATFLICAILLVWQARPVGERTRGSAAFTSALLVALILSTYWLGTKLLVDGYLGADAQARSIEQIDQSGSLILGGRPELQATLALMKDRPGGFGVGIEPTAQDILVAKTGLQSINYNPNNGYVEKYMFGGRIELHSMFGDLWSSWGFLGLALLLFTFVVLVREIPTAIARRTVEPVVLFLSVWTLWNLFFSPIYSSAPTLTLALGLILPAVVSWSAKTDGAPERP